MMKTNHNRHPSVGGDLLETGTCQLRISTYAGKVILIMLLTLFSSISFAQNVTQLEYFIDNDPGFGLATGIPITANSIIDINSIIASAAQPDGFHVLNIRAKDANGNWGFTEKRQFYIAPNSSTFDPPVANTSVLEYFFNDDPGFGNATSISITANMVIDINTIATSAALPNGFHSLYVRAQNTDGTWGFTEQRQIYVAPAASTTEPPVADISVLEYFFDEDPGFGNATSITITAGQVLDINELIPESLTAGFHNIFIRAKNTENRWGLSERRSVYITSPSSVSHTISDIAQIEYYFDGVDPGIGNGATLPITAGPLVDLNPVGVATSAGLVEGQHTITFRAKNVDGIWGMAETSTFDVLDDCTQPVAAFTAQLACAGQSVTFADISSSIQGDAQYRWYLNGDNIIDDTTVGDATFTYDVPGIYVVALAIRQGTICLDSISTTITIQPEPVAVFSTTGTVVNQPTNFTASANSLPTGATWEWDFDGDLTVDDNTVGATSFTYTSEATFNPTLTITDGLGCQITVANTVVISATGSSGTPSVSFLPESGCVGNNISFIDMSQNIPASATYSWDFNGDGTEDIATSGDQTYVYTTPGSYSATLTIDLGGSIIIDTKTVDIVEVPVIDFFATGTQVNQPTSFSAITSNLEPSAVWQWDFDANLTIDSNTPDNVSYTYNSEGTFNPNLKISNGFGCEAILSKPVLITGNGGGTTPIVKFIAENGCVNSNISFIDLSQNIPANATYSWDFNGDGLEDNSSVGNQFIAFATAGSFIAKLAVNIEGTITEFAQNIEIADVPVPDFSAMDVCEGSALSFTDESTSVNPSAEYSWDFDNDGVIDSNNKTNVSYSFSTNGFKLVKLIISNGFGCSQEIVKQVNVIALPTPDFEWDIACTAETISFNNLSTNVAIGAAYSWDFDGDGIEDSNTDGDVEFSFATKGVYEATLIITNGSGCETTITKTIEVIDRPQVAIGIIAKCYGQASQMIDLSQNVSPSATYGWDFDNNNLIDDNTVGSTEFTYSSYNSYVVNLTISNGGGCSSSAEKLVVFTDAATPDFSINKTCEGEEVVFTDLSSDLETGAIYSWDFDGNGIEDAATPGSAVFTYGSAAAYNATLTIDNGGQCLAFKTIQLDVTPSLEVDLGADLQLCEEGTVTFDAGVGYTAYLWPDGSTDQTFSVDKVGDYMVRIQDAKGCFNTDTISVSLLGPPKPSFDYFVELSLEGIKVHFTNTTTNGNAYLWDFGDETTSEETDPSHIYSDFSFYETSVYNVCVTSSNDCEQAQFCESIFVSPTGFMKEAGELISVYPNPVNRFVTLQLDQQKVNAKTIVIANSQGQLVWSSKTNQSTYKLNMTNYAQGAYFVLAQQENTLLFKRIIKQ